jgi:hypothetical protein
MLSENYWHEDIFPYCTDLLFWKGRMTYYEYDSALDQVVAGRYPARFPSALVYWGDRAEVFRDVFAGCGKFLKPGK